MFCDEWLKEYVRDRDEALLSLDEQKIRMFVKKWSVEIPSDPRAFWGGVYKAVLLIPNCPKDVREKAKAELQKLNMDEKIFGE